MGHSLALPTVREFSRVHPNDHHQFNHLGGPISVNNERGMGLDIRCARPPRPQSISNVFGEILTVLIAMEFNHTLQYVIAREQSIIQTKVVLLIALLALARKFIILDVHDLSPGHLLGLAAITLVLGIAYWLVRERDDRLTGIAKVTAPS
jgi:uncharacterized membrane protein (DUF373 family)